MELNANTLTLALPHKTLNLDVTLVYNAERRLQEVAIVSPATANELSTYFNRACVEISKILGLLEYEQLNAEKQYNLEKARVLIDVLPEHALKLKDTGMKPNDAWRDAFISRDSGCIIWQNAIDLLSVSKTLLNSKLKSFERAFYSCHKEKDRKNFSPTTPTTMNINELSRFDLISQQANQRLDSDIRAYHEHGG